MVINVFKLDKASHSPSAISNSLFSYKSDNFVIYAPVSHIFFFTISVPVVSSLSIPYHRKRLVFKYICSFDLDSIDVPEDIGALCYYSNLLMDNKAFVGVVTGDKKTIRVNITQNSDNDDIREKIIKAIYVWICREGY